MNVYIWRGSTIYSFKKNILKRPKQFYENIVKMLEYTIDPIEGYDIERFHKYYISGLTLTGILDRAVITW